LIGSLGCCGILGGGRVEWDGGVRGDDTIYQNESDKGLFDQSTRPPGAAIRSGHLARPPGPATRPRPATRPSPATGPGPARAGYPARLSILAMGLATRPSWPGHPAQPHVPADRPCHSARAGHPARPGLATRRFWTFEAPGASSPPCPWGRPQMSRIFGISGVFPYFLNSASGIFGISGVFHGFLNSNTKTMKNTRDSKDS